MFFYYVLHTRPNGLARRLNMSWTEPRRRLYSPKCPHARSIRSVVSFFGQHPIVPLLLGHSGGDTRIPGGQGSLPTAACRCGVS